MVFIPLLKEDTGIVLKVKDGDTVLIESEKGGRYTCRFYSINAPEIPHGSKDLY